MDTRLKKNDNKNYRNRIKIYISLKQEVNKYHQTLAKKSFRKINQTKSISSGAMWWKITVFPGSTKYQTHSFLH
jgi:hypothetical protein